MLWWGAGGSKIIENAEKPKHFLVRAMLWWVAGCSRITENAKKSMHFLVWVMLWRGAGGSRIIEKILTFPGFGNAALGRWRSRIIENVCILCISWFG